MLLEKPPWEKPIFLAPGKDFVRYFGAVERRWQGPSLLSKHDGYYARGVRGVRFHQLEKQWIGQAQCGFKPFGVFRRLYHSESPVAWFELGVSSQTHRYVYPVQAAQSDAVLEMLIDVLELPVRVASSDGETVDKRLWMIEGPLARLFAGATVGHEKGGTAFEKLVRVGDPTLLIEYDEGEITTFPSWTRTIDPEHVLGVDLKFLWFGYRQRQYGGWLLRRGSASKVAVRKVRLLLMRLHAELQGLRQTLRLLQTDELPRSAARGDETPLVRYMKRAAAMLAEPGKDGLDPATVGEVLNAYDELVNLDERAQLRQELQTILPEASTFDARPERALLKPAADEEDLKGDTIDVFVCYSHNEEDVAVKQRLIQYMESLKKYEGFDFWSDTEIMRGEKWGQKIDKALERADIALIFVSQWSLNSDFIRNVEVPRLLDRADRGELRIIPIIVSDCLWEKVPWLSSLQFWPGDERTVLGDYETEAKQTKLFKKIAAELSRLGEGVRARRREGLQSLTGVLPVGHASGSK